MDLSRGLGDVYKRQAQSIINSWNFLLKFVSFIKIIDCVMDLVRFQF
jgi:hypothetical protein